MAGYLPGLPGTTVTSDITCRKDAELVLKNIFSTGGLVLSQVAYTGKMEIYTIQNWIKRGFCVAPPTKRYNQRNFSRLVIIHMLKPAMLIGEICDLLSYINGKLDDESDDRIPDDELYLYLVDVILHMPDNFTPEAAEEAVQIACKSFTGAKETARRLHDVLLVMSYAYASASLHEKACSIMHGLPGFTSLNIKEE